jgi:hypothetical protein
MISTTPAQARYTTFSCPTPDGPPCNRSNVDTIVHRSWTGKHQHIERLRGTACDHECSEREGTLMARSKLAADHVERLRKWQRWGVCDAGTADLCAVALQTVSRVQPVATQRAQTHHQPVVRDVDVPGVPLDAAHATLRPTQVEGVHTAWAMGSGFLLWVDCGPRLQDPAAALMAQGIARTQRSPACSPTGGRPLLRRCVRSGGSCIVRAVVGKWAASPNHGARPPKTCAMRRA